MKMEEEQEQEYFCMLKEEYGNSCLRPKKFILFCRKVLFLKTDQISWEANVWFIEKLNISSGRYSRSNAIESFSFEYSAGWNRPDRRLVPTSPG